MALGTGKVAVSCIPGTAPVFCQKEGGERVCAGEDSVTVLGERDKLIISQDWVFEVRRVECDADSGLLDAGAGGLVVPSRTIELRANYSLARQLPLEMMSQTQRPTQQTPSAGETRWRFADVAYLDSLPEDVNHLGFSVLVLEGNIGAGKSTMARRLGEIGGFMVRAAMEPLPPPECLSAFYLDRQGQALNAQLFFLYHRAVELLKVWYAHLLSPGSTSIIVLDRGFDGDSLFAEMMAEEGSLTAAEMELYRSLASQVAAVLPPASATWLLEVPPESCLARVGRRARQGEAEISLEYLSRLGDAHERLKRLKEPGDAPGREGIRVLINSDCGEEEAVERARLILKTAKLVPSDRSGPEAFQAALNALQGLRKKFIDGIDGSGK